MRKTMNCDYLFQTARNWERIGFLHSFQLDIVTGAISSRINNMLCATWANRYIVLHDVVWSFTVTRLIIFFFVFCIILTGNSIWECALAAWRIHSASNSNLLYIGGIHFRRFKTKRFWCVEWTYIETLCNWCILNRKDAWWFAQTESCMSFYID